MKYWMVSQNVMGGHDVAAWEKAIKDTHRAFVGRSADEGNGVTFANVETGDLILIAKNSNSNKAVLLCGIAATKAKTEHLPGTPGTAQNIQLDYVLTKSDMDRLNLIFDKTCLFGDSPRPFAIAMMKMSSSGDKKNIGKLMAGIQQKKTIIEMENKLKLIHDNYQIILQGPPGTGKTRLAKELAYSLIMKDSLPSTEVERKEKLKELEKSDQFNLIQFHPAYSYEDFVRGIVAETIGVQITYKVKNKVLAEMAAEACKSDKPYVLIIDEINRANLPSVLGELIYALEYRGDEVESMYGLKSDNDRKIILPKNLFIIGTMNTADRSVGNIDYALRRRFVFETIMPDKNVVSEDAKNLFQSVTLLFVKDANNFGDEHGEPSQYLSGDFQFADVMLGHSYFIGDKGEVRDKLKYQIKPLLKEYVKDGVLKESALSEINGLKI